MKKKYFKKVYKVFFVCFFALFLFSETAHAATYTWDGGGVDNNWNTCANWSSDTCPLATDSVIFSASSTKNVDINVDITVAGFTINNGYVGTIAPLAGQLITVNGAFTQNAGTFTASAGTTTATSTFTYTGGTFNHNNGTMYFRSSTNVTLTFGSIVFNNVVFDKTTSVGNITTSIASDMTINGNLTALVSSGSQGLSIQSSVSGTPRTVTVGGHINMPSSTAGTGSLTFGGSGTFDLNVTLMGNFDISDAQALWASDLTFASSSTQIISKSNGSIQSTCDWYDTGSGNLALTANFSGSQILHPDNDTDFNFVATPYTFTSANIGIATSTSFTPDGAGSYIFTTANIMTGTFNATASTSIGVFVQTGGTFNATANGTTTITGNFTYTSGTFNANGGTMNFTPSANTTLTFGSAVFDNVVLGKISSGGGIITSIASDLTMNGNLAVLETFGQTLTVQSSVSGTPRTITVGGNFIFPNTSGSAGSVYFGGAGTFLLNVILSGNFDISDAQANLYSDLTFASSSTQTISKSNGTIQSNSNWYDTGSGNLALTANFSGSQVLNPDNDNDFAFVPTLFTFTSTSAKVATSTTFTPSGASSYIFTSLNLSGGGTFNATASTSILVFTQTSGVFNALASATTSFAGNFTYTAGTFNHNNGTVLFANGGGAGITVTSNSAQFNHVVFDMPGNVSSGSYTTSLGSNMLVLGSMIIQNTNTNTGFYTLRSTGTATRTVDVAGDLLFPSTVSSATVFAGATSVGFPISVNLQGNFNMVDSSAQMYFDVIFASSSNQTLTKTNGTIADLSNWFDTGSGDLVLQNNFSGAQVLNPDSATDFNFVVNPYTFTSGNVVLSSGDVFTPAGPAVYAYSSKVTVSAGTFNASNNSLFSGGLEITGGTFNASAGTTTIRSIQSYEGFVFTSGTFNHNNGTLLFDSTSVGMTVTPNAADLYNVVFDYTTSSLNSIYGSIGSNMNVLGSMTVRSNQPSSGLLIIRSSVSGTPRAVSVGGNFIVASTSPSTASVFIGDSSGNTFMLNFTVYGNIGIFDSSTIYSDFVFASSSDQTFSSTAGSISAASDWTINKTSGAFILLNALSTSGTANVATGTLRTSGLNLTTAVGGLSVGTAGNLQIQGGEFVSTSTFATGGTMTYEGTAGPYTLKNFSYKNLTIQGSGATFNTPNALTVGGNLTITAGTLDVTAGSHALNVAGNWSNSGTFTPRSGTVTLNGTNQFITGTSTFYNLTKSVASPDTLTFGANQTQTITNNWTANGTLGNLLSLRSSTTTTRWKVNPQTTRTLSYIDVKDSNNINLVAIGAVTGVVNSGNNLNWGFDVTPPVVSSIVVTPSATTTLISWNTDEVATSTIQYGTDSNFASSSISVSTTSHVLTLSNLMSGTLYNYRIVSYDAAGNYATTTSGSFVTIDITPPIISNINNTGDQTTQTITWDTNEITGSLVDYGLTSSYGTMLMSSGTSSHSVTLTGLTASTVYHYRITAIDMMANSATTTDFTFTTTANSAVAAQAQDKIPGSWNQPVFSGDGQPRPDVQFANVKFIFRKNLTMGMQNNDVKELQKFLNRNGFIIAKKGIGSPGKETTLFGPATKAALLKFQKAKKIKGANGVFGPGTRAVVNNMN